jgi:iron complex transport system ATP-binding protein
MNNHPELSASNINLTLQKKCIIKNTNFTLPAGKITAIIGPNGSGKSTVLKILSNILKPTDGTVYLNNKPIKTYKQREVAKNISFLPQHPIIPDNYKVIDVLQAGRFPHQGLLNKLKSNDLNIINWALTMTELGDYRNMPMHHLSGGLQQRAWLAMILCQETPIVILDEPTTYLDIKHQLQLIKLIKELNIDYGKTILWVLHDLNQAISSSDYLFVFKEGEIINRGAPDDIISSGTLTNIFDVSINKRYFNQHIKLMN